jgi:predicted ATPase
VIRTLAFAGYRSLQELHLAVGRLTVITGGNGTGKSNVYRALRLLADAADGNLGRALAREGGMPSAMWAGSARPTKPGAGTRLSVGFADETIAYELRLGLPAPPIKPPPPFAFDPEVKEETLSVVANPRARLLERRNLSVILRDEEGRPQTFAAQLAMNESVLAQLSEPHRYPVLSMLRERLRRWRFYHQIRTDQDSPLRAVQIGTRTPVLAHDGHDLAPALQTILENGDDRGLREAVAEAFEGAQLHIEAIEGRFRLLLETPGLFRPLDAAELSDGTLRYLALLAALRSPRPPELLVLNEPETSLHPRVLVPLARQIVAAAERSQIIVVSHATPLVDEIARARDTMCIELVKRDGATVVAHRKRIDAPSWKWTS